MKCDYEVEGGRFKPVTFSFTCETLDEVKMLWHTLNKTFSTHYDEEDGHVVHDKQMALKAKAACWYLVDNYFSENRYG